MHILFFTAEQWPTYRADVITLFGKYLPNFKVTSDIVTEQECHLNNIPVWPAGKAMLTKVPENRALQYILKFLHQLGVLLTISLKNYDAIQVRDMTLIAVFALLRAKLSRKAFCYWLSFPHSEEQVIRAKRRGFRSGARYWFPMFQGAIGQFLLYKFILPHSDHIFVQSQNMLEALEKKGVKAGKMSPVPMGVDVEAAKQSRAPMRISEFEKKRVIVYLGTLDPSREIETLLEMTDEIKQSYPDVLLLLIGDTSDKAYKSWLEQESIKLGLEGNVYWTGWVPMTEAWQYVMTAEVGLSPFPRNFILDMASPTKAVEYMALGIPVVVNDNPDQKAVVKESGAGLCVRLTAHNFAEAVSSILKDKRLANAISRKGKAYIEEKRSYKQVAKMVAEIYETILQ